jgi:D-alanyl-D-alanine carboxypeptidase
MVSTLADLHVWSRALATGTLLEPKVWKEAKKGAFPYAFADHYNGPGRWLQGLGFVETGGFIGKEGSLPGYESISQPNAITPTRMLQALAMALYGPKIGFGLTPAQALAPSYTGMAEEEGG